MSVAPESGRNRIMIYSPKNDGTYVVEFMTADGEALAISVPVGETRVLNQNERLSPLKPKPRPMRSFFFSGCSADWLKMKNPAAPAVTREAEEDWGR